MSPEAYSNRHRAILDNSDAAMWRFTPFKVGEYAIPNEEDALNDITSSTRDHV